MLADQARETCLVLEAAGQSPRHRKEGSDEGPLGARRGGHDHASRPPALAQSKEAIQKLNDEWAAAFNKGDAGAVAALYTADAYVLPAGAPMVKGRADIQKFWAGQMQH